MEAGEAACLVCGVSTRLVSKLCSCCEVACLEDEEDDQSSGQLVQSIQPIESKSRSESQPEVDFNESDEYWFASIKTQIIGIQHYRSTYEVKQNELVHMFRWEGNH